MGVAGVTVVGRICQLTGACSLAVCLFIVAGVAAAELRNWFVAARKRHQRIVTVKRCPSGRQVQLVQPTLPRSVVTANQRRCDRWAEQAERQFNLVWNGRDD